VDYRANQMSGWFHRRLTGSGHHGQTLVINVDGRLWAVNVDALT
jgi:hypothetical protein